MDMSKTGYITARIEPKLKARAAQVLARVGVSTTDAITMFLRQVVLRNGLPFEVRVPNAETKRAIEELENAGTRSKLKRYATAHDMFGDVTLGTKKRAKRPA
jgi:DNA-damage-inducible protein J